MQSRLIEIEGTIEVTVEADSPDIELAATFVLMSELDRSTRQPGGLDALDAAISSAELRVTEHRLHLARAHGEDGGRCRRRLANLKRTLALMSELRDAWAARIAAGLPAWDPAERRNAGYAAADAMVRAAQAAKGDREGEAAPPPSSAAGR